MPAARSFAADLRVVLRSADFRKLFAVRLSSQASDGAFQVGLASLVFFSAEREATTQAAAVAAVVTVLPYTIVGPFAGVLLDVWARRQVLFVANAVRSLLVLGLAALVVADGAGPLVYVGALLSLSLNRFFLAGLGAALPHTVPRHELVMANAVSPTCGTVAALAGAGGGYVLRRAIGPGDATDAVVLVVAACGYLAASLLARRMQRDLLGPDVRAPLSRRSLAAGAGDLGRDLVSGARHVRARRRAAHALTAIGTQRLAYGVTTIATVLLCRNHFNDPSDVDAGLSLLAMVLAATGLGVALAALVTPPAAHRFGTRGWIVIVVAASALFELCFVAWPHESVLLALALVLGAAAQSAKICVDAIVQDAVDDAFRGRVFSFYDVVFNVAFVSAAGLSVLAVPADGFSRPVYVAVAAGYALTAAGYAWRSRPRVAGAEAERQVEVSLPR